MRQYSILFIGTEEDSVQKSHAQRIKEIVLAPFDGSAGGSVEWVRVDALFDGLRILQDRYFDLILAELSLPDAQGLATVRHLKQDAPQTPVIVICGLKDRDTAVSAVRQGAYDFFCYEEMDPVNLRRAIGLAIEGNASGAGGSAADRRTHARFPCKLAVNYRALEHPFLEGQGISETVNISSKGILFAAHEALNPGQLLQVSVDWPARLDNEIPLKLVAEGRVIRIVDGLTAMHIDKYEFRTRKMKAAQQNAV